MTYHTIYYFYSNHSMPRMNIKFTVIEKNYWIKSNKTFDFIENYYSSSNEITSPGFGRELFQSSLKTITDWI